MTHTSIKVYGHDVIIEFSADVPNEKSTIDELKGYIFDKIHNDIYTEELPMYYEITDSEGDIQQVDFIANWRVVDWRGIANELNVMGRSFINALEHENVDLGTIALIPFQKYETTVNKLNDAGN